MHEGQLTCAPHDNGRCPDYNVYSGDTGAGVAFHMQFASTLCSGDGGSRHRRAVSAYKPTKVEHPDVHKPGAVYRYEQGSNSFLTLVFDREIPNATSLTCSMYDEGDIHTVVASPTGTRKLGGTALAFDLSGVDVKVDADYLFECDFEMRLPAPGTLRSANVGAAVEEPKYIPADPDAPIRSPELGDGPFSSDSHAHPDPHFYNASDPDIQDHSHVNYTVAIVEGQALTIDLITRYPEETGVLVVHPDNGPLYLHKDPADFSPYDIWANHLNPMMDNGMVKYEPYRWKFTAPGNYSVTHVDTYGDFGTDEMFEVSVRGRAKSSLRLRNVLVPAGGNMAVTSEKLPSADQLQKRQTGQLAGIGVGIALVMIFIVVVATNRKNLFKSGTSSAADEPNDIPSLWMM